MPLRTLLLDDDLSFRKLVELRLKDWQPDIQITVADNLAAARKILDSDKEFDLVVLDQHLPDGLGSELSEHPKVAQATVLAISADASPDLPGQAVKAGAQHFLGKHQVTEPLFIPLVEALLERKQLEARLFALKLKESKVDTIRTLLTTLRHEINNPLGAVLGGIYLIRNSGQLADDQKEAVALVEKSSNRIKHVIQQLCEAVELEQVQKAHEKVFQVPGDKPWGAK